MIDITDRATVLAANADALEAEKWDALNAEAKRLGFESTWNAPDFLLLRNPDVSRAVERATIARALVDQLAEDGEYSRDAIAFAIDSGFGLIS